MNDENEGYLKVWAGHGGTPSGKRQSMQDEFMAHPGPCVLVGTYDAWGESLNLHDADCIIFCMLPWTSGMLEQAQGRGYRLGLLRELHVVFLFGEGTADEAIADIVLPKLEEASMFQTGMLTGVKPALRGVDEYDEWIAEALDEVRRISAVGG